MNARSVIGRVVEKAKAEAASRQATAPTPEPTPAKSVVGRVAEQASEKAAQAKRVRPRRLVAEAYDMPEEDLEAEWEKQAAERDAKRSRYWN